MIAADTSALSAYFKGEPKATVTAVRRALSDGQLVLPPVVVTEVLSAPNSQLLEPIVLDMKLLPVLEGYWLRAAQSRRRILTKGLKAKVADALIAQSCVDHGVPLIAGDRDFQHFARYCGLKLA